MRTYVPVGVRTLPCQGCGKDYEASRSDARWCPGCRWAKTHAHNSRPRPERLAPATRPLQCKECGKRFEAKRYTKSALCWDCRHPGEYDACPNCGGRKMAVSKRCKGCHAAALPHIHAKEGAANPMWKGGRIRQKGYIRVKNPVPGGKPRYIGEHTLVWERANGPVPKGWLVHHLNGLKDDNRLENLVAMSRTQHHRNNHEPWEARIRDLEEQIT